MTKLSSVTILLQNNLEITRHRHAPCRHQTPPPPPHRSHRHRPCRRRRRPQGIFYTLGVNTPPNVQHPRLPHLMITP